MHAFLGRPLWVWGLFLVLMLRRFSRFLKTLIKTLRAAFSVSCGPLMHFEAEGLQGLDGKEVTRASLGPESPVSTPPPLGFPLHPVDWSQKQYNQPPVSMGEGVQVHEGHQNSRCLLGAGAHACEDTQEAEIRRISVQSQPR
jgi:hypothetical protein